MVLVKKWKFGECFVLCKIHPEKVFGDVLVRKQPLSRQHKHGFKKKAKLAFLPKGIVHDFGQKDEKTSTY